MHAAQGWQVLALLALLPGSAAAAEMCSAAGVWNEGPLEQLERGTPPHVRGPGMLATAERSPRLSTTGAVLAQAAVRALVLRHA